MVHLIKTLVPIPPNRKFSILEMLLFIVLISSVLYFGRTLFIPLSFSMLISFVLYPLCKWMEKKRVPKMISIFLSISILFILFGAITYLLFSQIEGFLQEWQTFRTKLIESLVALSAFFENRYGINIGNSYKLQKNMFSNTGGQVFDAMISSAFSISMSLFFLIIIPVFSALILYYRQMLVKVLYKLFPANKKKDVREILTETIHTYYSFVRGMLLVYLIVGILNSIGLAILGVPHAIAFGFIASILTFIPYVGIIISSLLPITISWITFDSMWYPMGIIMVFSIVQLLEANIIFPIVVGNRLKINPLIIIIVIIAGGILWGAAGMILFIPIISIVKLIADRTESLKAVSILLGTNTSEAKE